LSASAHATKCGSGQYEDTHPQAVECWYVDLRACEAALHDIERATPRLSEWDRKNAADFAEADAGAEWLAAHIALRILIERAIGPRWRGVPLERAAHAKPRLVDAPIVFSLSHVEGCALIAVGPDEPLGIDMERMRTVHMRPERCARIEGAAAALSVEALPHRGEARFLQAWVRMEAAAKAQGCGIGRLLTRLGLTTGSGVAADGVAARARELGEAIKVYDLGLGAGLFGAVAAGPAVVRPEVLSLPTGIGGVNALLR
jgi:4'-phosphopantetheinyl transferase